MWVWWGTWSRRRGARRHYDGTQLVALFIGLVSPVVGTSPPGRLLNRFLEDVTAMDTAFTNIMGVMFGSVWSILRSSATP